MIDREELLGRITAGRAFMQAQATKAERCAARYREMSGRSDAGDGFPPGGPSHAEVSGSAGTDTQPLGEVNYPAINVRQKVAAAAYTAPDFAVEAEDGDSADLVRRDLVEQWRRGGWVREMQRCLFDRVVGGMGFAVYLWDRDGFGIERVDAADLFVDPHTTDSGWKRLRWGGRRVSLPAWVASQRYPGILARSGVQSKPSADRRDVVHIDVYWDAEMEVEVHGSEVLDSRLNPYAEVPIATLQGDINPDRTTGQWSRGDYDQVTGAAELLRRSQDIIGYQAQHGGGYAWVDGTALDPASREALLAGDHTKVIVLNGPAGNSMGYTPVQPVNPALLETLRYLAAGIDADMGVTQYQRGVIANAAKFATEAMLLQSSSGVRGAKAHAEFEQYCTAIAERQVILTAKHGDPYAMAPGLWRAYRSVRNVRVIEESTSWRDPAMEQQSAMSLVNLVAQLMPIMMQLAQAGLMPEVPNLRAYLDDALRSFRRRELTAYWRPFTPAAAPAAPAAGLEGQLSAEAGGEGAPGPGPGGEVTGG